MNHCFTCFKQIFKIFTQSSLVFKPRKGSLYNPSFVNNLEAGLIVGSHYDFNNVTKNSIRPLYQLSAISAICKNNFQAYKIFFQPSQNQFYSFRVMNIGCMNYNGQNKTERINYHMTFTAIDFLVTIYASYAASARSFNRLTIGYASTWRRFFSKLCANIFTKHRIDMFYHIGVPPFGKIVINQ